MGFLANGISAIGRLVTVVVLLCAFLVGMAGVVYLSLSGTEIKVPEIVGKDFIESEKELAALGLKIKRRADRASSEKINTVLEQLPKAGETVKTGQTIRVVVSKFGGTEDDTPKSLIKDIESDDTEKIGEMISDKPKKPKSNSNANTNKKKADTTRDVIANTATSTSISDDVDKGNSKSDDSNKKDTGTPSTERGNKNTSTGAAPKPPALSRSNSSKPAGERPKPQ